MGLVSTIKSWQIPRDRTFDVLAWDESDYKKTEIKKQKIDILYNMDTAEGGQCYISFDSNKGFGTTYIHYRSVMLQPVNDWGQFDKMWNSYDKFAKKQHRQWLSTEYRLLMNMKFRGTISGGQVLLSDINNKQRTAMLPLPRSSFDPGTNECIVFEYEMSEGAVRNYFYNASKREFVFLSKPSWIP